MNSTTLKAARGGLDWSRQRLAKEAGVHANTVAYYERMKGEIAPLQVPQGAIPRIVEALARQGVATRAMWCAFTWSRVADP